MSLANAGIWYAPDGYDPKANGINGRRVAGESFLRGFFAHAEVEEFVCLTHGQDSEQHFRNFAARERVRKPIRTVRLEAAATLAPVEVVNYPSPNYATECWRRAQWGDSAYAICGVTHTTATKAIMQGFYDLRAAPQMAWDAVICTSRAVQASVITQMDLADEFLARRFGGKAPARPLLPVLPLGVNCDDYARDPEAGQALRARLGIAEDEMACAIIARLSPNEKFDPLPLYLALAQAQRRCGTRFHLLLCGQFRDAYAHKVFIQGAKALMPEVGFHLLDGADAAQRKAALSGADIFLFPIDNVQETFGLGPIEAMAAGLPLIVSDWDGMRDTVTRGVGIRVPTEMPRPELTAELGQRYFDGTENYIQYISQLSAMTRLDNGAMVEALVTLAQNPALRAKMSRNGLARARQVYDWSVVIPQMQALWAEQAAILASARARGEGHVISALRLPPAPSPGVFFKAYPSAPPARLDRIYLARPVEERPDLITCLNLRDYEHNNRMFESRLRVSAVLKALDTAPEGATSSQLAKASGISECAVTRILYWLMKYDFAE